MYTGTLINDLMNAVANTEKRIPLNMGSQEDKLAYWYSVAQREIAHMSMALAPGIGLPDATVLLAHADAPGELVRIAAQQLGQRVGGGLLRELDAPHDLAPLPVPR